MRQQKKNKRCVAEDLLFILPIIYATLFNKKLPGVLNSQCVNSAEPVQKSSLICKLKPCF